MLKIGLSTKGDKDLRGAAFFEDCQKSGIDVIELACGYERLQNYDYQNLKNLGTQYHVGLWTFHFPYAKFGDPSIDLSSPNQAIRRDTLNYFDEYLNRASDIGFHNFIVHTSMEPVDTERSEHIKWAKESLLELSEKAEHLGVRLAVEDLPRTCLGNCRAELKDLISVDSRLNVCFDTNHLLTEDDLDFVKAMGSKIITIHVSDYDLTHERHWLPGEGKVDWYALYDELMKMGYDGPWLYEISFECPDTISRRELTCADFAKNAFEIMNKLPITVISKPNTVNI